MNAGVEVHLKPGRGLSIYDAVNGFRYLCGGQFFGRFVQAGIGYCL